MQTQISSRQLIDYFNQLDDHEDHLIIEGKKYNTKQYYDDDEGTDSYHVEFSAIPKDKEDLGYAVILRHKDINKNKGCINVCEINFYFRKYKGHDDETKYVNDLKIMMDIDKNNKPI